MIINWLGQSCFKFQDKINGQEIALVIDPFDPNYTGLKLPNNLSANIVAITHGHHDHNFIQGVQGWSYIIDTAGEYEIGGVCIDAIDSYHDAQKGKERGHNLIFRLEFSDLTITHLGDLGHLLGPDQLERISGTDILIVPVGGHYTIDGKQAVEVINQVDPKMVIPMHYQLPGLKFELDSLENFIKTIGLSPTSESRLKISRRDLDNENLQLVVLSPSV
jgi:L-ascorbate metabolism protein UlaG (beta-lactamase superfamily)